MDPATFPLQCNDRPWPKPSKELIKSQEIYKQMMQERAQAQIDWIHVNAAMAREASDRLKEVKELDYKELVAVGMAIAAKVLPKPIEGQESAIGEDMEAVEGPDISKLSFDEQVQFLKMLEKMT